MVNIRRFITTDGKFDGKEILYIEKNFETQECAAYFKDGAKYNIRKTHYTKERIKEWLENGQIKELFMDMSECYLEDL